MKSYLDSLTEPRSYAIVEAALPRSSLLVDVNPCAMHFIIQPFAFVVRTCAYVRIKYNEIKIQYIAIPIFYAFEGG